MLTQQIRRSFLQYFKNKGHAVIPSSPVVPHGDPTLLFTNAGMNQFKDVFLGKSERDYKRAVTSQKCIRAGGKHNDLENVGHTSRHLTFFEMLGNFSFGDYFKKDAIQFAWEVTTEVFKLDPELIWPTVFRDDDEAFELWKKLVPEKKITRFGEKENFWAMGDTGPCGPCSELLFDRGSKYGNAKNPLEDISGERYLEFWNLVFMQYNRNASGVLEPLPKPSIDTGAGIERIVSLKMGVDTVFDTDVLFSLIQQIEKISGKKYIKDDHEKAPAFRVIADHLRCLAFAIADGVQPSNVDRGYVLRKVLRRAVRYGRSLGMDAPFLAKVLPALIETMGEDYPELQKSRPRIEEILISEEESFFRTLRRGGNILNQIIEDSSKHNHQISGEDAFKLKDTYGLPLEEILLIAKDAELTVDLEKFQQLEKKAKELSKSSQKVTQQVVSDTQYSEFAKKNGPTKFMGYQLYITTSKVVGLLSNGNFVEQLSEGEEGIILLDQSPFYAEMGGQIGDTGEIVNAEMKFTVSNTKAPYKGLVAHEGKVEFGKVKVGETVIAAIEPERRKSIENNHTATHLLHWALQVVLGEHVKQAGSVVEPHRLRFDFNHHKSLTSEEIRQIEDLVNAKIRDNVLVNWYEIPFEEAQKRGEIKQFFGEKYDSKVRVVDIDFSKELCGGTHVPILGQIGLFRVIKEGSISAGVRRIEAVTGADAENYARQYEDMVNNLSTSLKTQPQKLLERVEKLLEENKQLSQAVSDAKKGQLSQIVTQLLPKQEQLGSIPAILTEVSLNPDEVKTCSEELLKKMSSGVVVLVSINQDKCVFTVRVSDDLVSKGIQAGQIVKEINPIIEGSGGGKGNNAQAAGKAIHKISEALEHIRKILSK